MIRHTIRQSSTEPLLICDGLHGVHCPRDAIQTLENMRAAGALLMLPSTLAAVDHAILRDGPDHELYWDAWDGALSYLSVSIAGVSYFLHHEYNVWLIPSDWEWSDDLEWFQSPS